MSQIPDMCFDLAKRIYAIEKKLGMTKPAGDAVKSPQKPPTASMPVNEGKPAGDPDAPLCSDCGMMMTRTGVCYSCPACGAAGGCG